MALYPKARKPARTFPANMIHALRLSINQATPDPAGGTVALALDAPRQMGTIPGGAVILPAYVIVKTAFTATATVNIGTELDPDGVIPTAGFAPAATGVKTVTTGELLGRTTGDTTVFALLGTVEAPAGAAEIVVPFYVQQD